MVQIELFTGPDLDGDLGSAANTLVRVRKNAGVLGKGTNIACDRYFTSLQLATHLFFEHKTTIVATIKSNRRGLKEADKMSSSRTRQVNGLQTTNGPTRDSTSSRAPFHKWQDTKQVDFISTVVGGGYNNGNMHSAG